ncbi:hypothetical protein CDAR_318931 [Caerostris darwini]|uniref:Uncharacterized protein n=1 Tax=Caerostris darwini TaxID=1538125 RepID=A0AAV4TWY4_9ARAC|nr:hypothetical protein CDAR_318931 [Caerostris darwini]
MFGFAVPLTSDQSTFADRLSIGHRSPLGRGRPHQRLLRDFPFCRIARITRRRGFETAHSSHGEHAQSDSTLSPDTRFKSWKALLGPRRIVSMIIYLFLHSKRDFY